MQNQRMKSRSILSMFAMFLVLMLGSERNAQAESILDTIVENDYVMMSADANGAVSFPDAQTYGAPGEPVLPIVVKTYTFPKTVSSDSIVVTLDDVSENEFLSSFTVEPAPPWRLGTEEVWPEGKTIVDGKDVGVYENDAYFPEQYLNGYTVGKKDDEIVVEVRIAPYQYNPVTGSIKKIQAATVAVSYEEALTAASEAEKPAIRIPYDYVIITTSTIVSNSAVLDEFVSSKEARGFSVLVADETVWGGGVGDEAAENIRAWLKDNYDYLEISYVLLIGNPTPSDGDVPMKAVKPSDRELPTDFYYAELSGDWDLDGDGIYGEYEGDYGEAGGADKFAEVSVGRIHQYSTDDYTDLDNILAKAIEYENEPISDISWRKKGLFPAYPLDDNTPGYNMTEELFDDFLTDDAWDRHRVYEEDYDLSPETVGCSNTSVTAAWNSDAFGAVFWLTHGSSISASHIVSVGTVSNWSDAHQAHGFQGSCSTGRPEYVSNLAYRMLQEVFITTVAASRTAFYWSGAKVHKDAPTTEGMGYRYGEFLLHEMQPAGDAINSVRTTITLNDAGQWGEFSNWNLYGDPSLGINTSSNYGADAVSGIPNDYAVYGLEYASLGDYVTLSTEDGGYADIASAGLDTGNFEGVYIGVLTETENVISGSNVSLRDRAFINGDVWAAGSITKQNNITINGEENEYADITAPLPTSLTVKDISFDRVVQTRTTVSFGETKYLEPGVYYDLFVSNGASLVLTAGSYYFDSLYTSTGSTVELDTSGGPIKIFVQSELSWRNEMDTSDTEAAANFLLAYSGSGTLYLSGDFSGTIAAPNAKVVASQSRKKFVGMAVGKAVAVHQFADFVFVPFVELTDSITPFDGASGETVELDMTADSVRTLYTSTWPGYDNEYWDADVIVELNSVDGGVVPDMTLAINGTTCSLESGQSYQICDIEDSGPYTISVSDCEGAFTLRLGSQ